MDNANRFALMIEALTELAQEEQALSTSAAPQTPPMADLPTLNSVLADISPLPHEALFLGMADDGLPVLLNLSDPVPGPILIAGGSGSGKTKFLQTIARAADMLHTPEQVQYGVITSRPNEWKSIPASRNNAGIYDVQGENIIELLQSLVVWAHRNKGGDQSVLLLIDDLEAITNLDESSQQNLRWLLLRGSSRRVWLFITLNSSTAHNLTAWLEFFHTRLFGHVKDAEAAYLLTGNRSHTLDHLTAGIQFAMREERHLLSFWLPAIGQ
ncbi:MAG: hypothetical protein DPW18_19605 [Chloroflexi bacterium]|nr:hypothetical protein [Chloroflexota bacterium]MDL1944981.1 NACHT domain-containing protein [Chloroflexi bacterium CFX2]